MKPKIIKTQKVGTKEALARAQREERAAKVTGKPTPKNAKAILAEAEAKAAPKAPATGYAIKAQANREREERARSIKRDNLREKRAAADRARIEAKQIADGVATQPLPPLTNPAAEAEERDNQEHGSAVVAIASKDHGAAELPDAALQPDEDKLIEAGAEIGLTPDEMLEPVPDDTEATLEAIVAEVGPVLPLSAEEIGDVQALERRLSDVAKDASKRLEADKATAGKSVMAADALLGMLDGKEPAGTAGEPQSLLLALATRPIAPGPRKPVIPTSNSTVQRLVDRIEAARGDLEALKGIRVGLRTQTYRRMAGRYHDALVIEAGGVPVPEPELEEPAP